MNNYKLRKTFQLTSKIFNKYSENSWKMNCNDIFFKLGDIYSFDEYLERYTHFEKNINNNKSWQEEIDYIVQHKHYWHNDLWIYIGDDILDRAVKDRIDFFNLNPKDLELISKLLNHVGQSLMYQDGEGYDPIDFYKKNNRVLWQEIEFIEDKRQVFDGMFRSKVENIESFYKSGTSLWFVVSLLEHLFIDLANNSKKYKFLKDCSHY